MSIPKVIHYCWFGKNPLPETEQKCIKSWKKYCPDYEIVEWNEDNFDLTSCRYAKEAYEAKKYAFVSDYVRLKVLYEYGGVYLDTDVEVIKPFDDLLSSKGFMGFEYGKPTPYGRVYCLSTGVGVGSEPKNEIIKIMLDDYNDIPFLKRDGEYDIMSSPVRNTKALLKIGLKDDGTMQNIDGFMFYPTEYLAPIDFETKKKKITAKTHSIHLYSGSWLSESQKPSFKTKLQCTKIGMFLWRMQNRLSGMDKILCGIRNSVRFGLKKCFSRANIRFAGKVYFDKNTKFAVEKRSTVTVGKNVESDGRCTIIVKQGANLKIGDDVFFDEGVMISCLKSVTIGNGTLFGPNVKIFDNNQRFSRSKGVSCEQSTQKVTIGENCWIAPNVTILKGSTIGKNCVIGVGCVISGDVADYSKVTLKQEHNITTIDDRQI